MPLADDGFNFIIVPENVNQIKGILDLVKDINDHVDVAMMNIENDSDSILKKLNTVAMQLEFISKYESNFSEYNNIISGNIIEIQDLYDKLNDFSTKLLIDSKRL